MPCPCWVWVSRLRARTCCPADTSACSSNGCIRQARRSSSLDWALPSTSLYAPKITPYTQLNIRIIVIISRSIEQWKIFHLKKSFQFSNSFNQNEFQCDSNVQRFSMPEFLQQAKACWYILSNRARVFFPSEQFDHQWKAWTLAVLFIQQW